MAEVREEAVVPLRRHPDDAAAHRTPQGADAPQGVTVGPRCGRQNDRGTREERAICGSHAALFRAGERVAADEGDSAARAGPFQSRRDHGFGTADIGQDSTPPHVREQRPSEGHDAIHGCRENDEVGAGNAGQPAGAAVDGAAGLGAAQRGGPGREMNEEKVKEGEENESTGDMMVVGSASVARARWSNA